MGSADQDKPSLEAPSLGFRRRRKRDSGDPGGGEQSTVPEVPTVDDAPPGPGGGEQSPVLEPPTVDDAPPAEEQAAEPQPAPTTRTPRRPLNGPVAAALAGVAAGIFLVAGTFGGLQGCASLRGTTSCGGGPGFLLLALIFVVAVVIGAAVLRAAKVASAGSISFLAVSLAAVLSVLFLLDVLDSLAGAVVAGVLTVAAYLLSHWVTTRFIDTAA